MGYSEQHTDLESKGILFPILVTIAILIGGIVEVVPPFFMSSTIEPIPEVKPYSALELAGRDIYIREGCINCHSQMIRPFKWETARFDPAGVYGDAPYSKAGEYIYDRPFLWGSKRTGPDLWHEGTIKDEAWHYEHFRDPRMGGAQEGSVMPAYPWLYEYDVDPDEIIARMEALNVFGTYEGENAVYLENARAELEGKKEIDAMIAYMMKLGRDTAQTTGAASTPETESTASAEATE